MHTAKNATITSVAPGDLFIVTVDSTEHPLGVTKLAMAVRSVTEVNVFLGEKPPLEQIKQLEEVIRFRVPA